MSKANGTGTLMPRKRKKATAGDKKRRQYNIAFDPNYAVRIDDTAEALGLEATALLRMIIKEHIAEYEKRADAIRSAESPK